ncbi:hypothetical protein [Actinoplanes sp. NBRC 103695]|uniref:hypothetical protein n=1 Tax=Actinoplanes sp. NBRC 103695 TaxID=3032202 RepID=UPI0025576C52|nr:hypothetical protein [Actinoplanes sp. NBRC 103695]
MGLDFKSIPVPLDADPVRAIRADPALRATAEDYPSFGVRFGDERFAGSRRCSDPAFPAGTADRIDALDVAAARRGFSVAEMARNGVYKVRQGDPHDGAFARVLADLRSFADHCRDTAARELGLIITLF